MDSRRHMVVSPWACSWRPYICGTCWVMSSLDCSCHGSAPMESSAPPSVQSISMHTPPFLAETGLHPPSYSADHGLHSPNPTMAKRHLNFGSFLISPLQQSFAFPTQVGPHCTLPGHLPLPPHPALWPCSERRESRGWMRVNDQCWAVRELGGAILTSPALESSEEEKLSSVSSPSLSLIERY